MLDLGVELGEPLPVLLEVVKGAVVRLCVPVLRAVDVGALAGDLDEADLLAAQPALVQVGLIRKESKS